MDSSSSSSSSSMSVALIEDVIVNILSRLPVKPVSRFKCVSKQWLALISEPQFAKLQLQQSLKDEAPSCHRIIKNCYLQSIHPEALDGGEDNEEAVVQRHYPTTDPEDGFFFIGSCNGLVCLGVYESNRYILYNPTTRLSRNMTASPLDAENEQYELFSGLGHDPSTDDYKVIRGIFRRDSEPGCWVAEVDIFSLKTNSWRRIQQNGVITGGLYQNGIYSNASLHWFSDHRSNNKGKNSIVSFNIVEEELKEDEIPLPNVMELEGLGFIGERLFVHSSTWRDSSKAWIMKEYGNGESWTELFSVDTWTEGFPGAKYYTTPLTCSRSGKVVFDVDGREMVLFNTQDGTLKEIRTDDADYETMVYVQSLVSPYLASSSHIN